MNLNSWILLGHGKRIPVTNIDKIKSQEEQNIAEQIWGQADLFSEPNKRTHGNLNPLQTISKIFMSEDEGMNNHLKNLIT